MSAYKHIRGTAYRLGERKLHISDIENYESRLRDMKVPAKSGMGIGNFWVTQDSYRLIEAAVAQTLAITGTSPGSIDHVIICSSHFADTFQRRNRALAAALSANRVCPARMHVICGSGCAELLRGVELACDLLELHRATTVLVVGVEALADQHLPARLLDYALVSDAAVSLIVSCSPELSVVEDSLRIATVTSTSMLARIGSDMSIRDGKEYGEATAAALQAVELSPSSVTKVFGNNTFLPVKIYRQSSAGFSKRQMYLENVERIGHCLACDPMINLADFDQHQQPGCFVLAAEAEGHASVLVLQRSV